MRRGPRGLLIATALATLPGCPGLGLQMPLFGGLNFDKVKVFAVATAIDAKAGQAEVWNMQAHDPEIAQAITDVREATDVLRNGGDVAGAIKKIRGARPAFVKWLKARGLTDQQIADEILPFKLGLDALQFAEIAQARLWQTGDDAPYFAPRWRRPAAA